MLDFVFILLIIFEILLTTLAVMRLIELEKKVIAYNEALNLYSDLILELNKKIREILQKINKVVSVIKDNRIRTAGRIIKITIDFIQIYLMIRSLNLSKGLKSFNFKALKRLFATALIKKIITRLVFG